MSSNRVSISSSTSRSRFEVEIRRAKASKDCLGTGRRLCLPDWVVLGWRWRPGTLQIEEVWGARQQSPEREAEGCRPELETGAAHRYRLHERVRGMTSPNV